jgi:hypothetical protein
VAVAKSSEAAKGGLLAMRKDATVHRTFFKDILQRKTRLWSGDRPITAPYC